MFGLDSWMSIDYLSSTVIFPVFNSLLEFDVLPSASFHMTLGVFLYLKPLDRSVQMSFHIGMDMNDHWMNDDWIVYTIVMFK